MKKLIKSLIILVLTVSLPVLSGCNDPFSFLNHTKDQEPTSNLAAGSILLDSRETRLQTISLISNAKKAIFVELSALSDPEIINLLIDKSQAGLNVRILLDQWQRENEATLKSLKNHNVSVQSYPAEKGQYQRVRYLVVDYKTAIFYCQDWNQKKSGSHSMAIKFSGDTAWTMACAFDKDWIYTTTISLNLPEKMELPEDNVVFMLDGVVKQQLLKYINTATSEIMVITEQLSDADTVAALLAAKKRGCSVQIILSPSCIVATPDTISDLNDNKIEIRYFNNPDKLTLGYNLGLFDHKTLFLTSSAWTHYTFFINHESALAIPSTSAVEKIRQVFVREWQAGKK